MWKKPLAVLGASALICGGEIAREVSTFRVRRYRIRVPGMKRGGTVRMLYLSDLHGKEYGKENENLLAKIEREDPDLILVGGDMLTRTQPDTDRTAAAILGKMASLCPVFAANGNHEQKMKEQPATGISGRGACRRVRWKRLQDLPAQTAFIFCWPTIPCTWMHTGAGARILSSPGTSTAASCACPAWGA